MGREPIRNLRTPASADVHKGGLLQQASLTLSPQSPSFFPFLLIFFLFRRLLRRLRSQLKFEQMHEVYAKRRKRMRAEACFSKVPVANRPGKLFSVCCIYIQDHTCNNFVNNTMKLSGLRARTVLPFNKF